MLFGNSLVIELLTKIELYTVSKYKFLRYIMRMPTLRIFIYSDNKIGKSIKNLEFKNIKYDESRITNKLLHHNSLCTMYVCVII